MNNGIFRGYLKDIEPSHSIGDVTYDKAKLLVKRASGQEDLINIKYKSFSNRYSEDDEVCLKGNVRSYSYKVSEDKNKVVIYVFTYFDEPEDVDDEVNNRVELDGRICKINPLRVNKNGKHNIHFILANNIVSDDGQRRLNSYIPCIAWGTLAKELAKLSVNTQLQVVGELHSREHKKVLDDGEVVIRVAHELHIQSFEVIE